MVFFLPTAFSFLLLLLDVLFVPFSLSVTCPSRFIIVPFRTSFLSFFSPPFQPFSFSLYSFCAFLPYIFLTVSFFPFCFLLPFSFFFIFPFRPFLYFRNSSTKEFIKFPTNRERKLRITFVLVPSKCQASKCEHVNHKV